MMNIKQRTIMLLLNLLIMVYTQSSISLGERIYYAWITLFYIRHGEHGYKSQNQLVHNQLTGTIILEINKQVREDPTLHPHFSPSPSFSPTAISTPSPLW
jgi:hypothetical protein